MTCCRKIIKCVSGLFLCGKAAFCLFLYNVVRKQAVVGLAFSFICFLPGQVYALTGENGWFWPDAVICKIDTGTPIDLGKLDGTLLTLVSVATALQGSCLSTAFVIEDGSSNLVPEGAYCLTIRETKRFLTNTQNPAYRIPLDFYYPTQGGGLPIGDGMQNNPMWMRGQGTPSNSITGPVAIPLQWGMFVRINPLKQTVPAGVYQGVFTIDLVSGARQRRDYPNMNTPSACAAFPGPKVASKITVKAVVEESCNLTTLRHIDLGRTARLEFDIHGQGMISVRCSDKTKFQVGLNKGLHGSSTQQRVMREATGRPYTVNYNLYKDFAGNQLWTDEWNTPNVLHDTANGSAQNYEVFAIVPRQSYKPYGVYSDTVIVELRLE